MYRVEVAWLLDAGEPLSDVEEGIGRITDLTQEETAIERYRRSPGLTEEGPRETKAQRHPLEFDESGFPIDQASPTFAERVARLLGSA